MSLARRNPSPRLPRLPRPPNQLPTDPFFSAESQDAATKTPQRRPSLQSNESARSTSSAGSLINNDTVFDSSRSTSETPISPFSSPETSPKASGDLLSSNEINSRDTVRSLEEPLSDHETPEDCLYNIMLGVEKSMSDTPSRKNGRYLRNPRMSSATSTSIPKRPTLHRQSNIDEVLRQQRPKTSRLPGAFESQNIDIDMGAHYSASDPAASTADELAQHTDEACQILGEFIDLPIIVSLMHQEHQLRPTDWQLLKEILKEHKKARLDPRHLIQVLQIRIENQPKILKFVPWGSKKQPRHINNNIHNCIKRQTKATKDLIKTPASKPKPGWIYVFESPENAPGYVKIGKTDREPQERKGEWEKCGITLVEVEDINRNAFDHYSIVESLIKVELHNKRRKYTCDRPHHGANGPVEHEEWYEIDKKTALNSIRRWRHWIKTEEPFNENGLLTPYWYWRAQKLPKFINDADWDRWTQPSPLDYVDFQFEQFGLGYYAQIKAHLGRKDFHFCLTGGMMMFILYTQFGMAGAVWGLLALLIL